MPFAQRALNRLQILDVQRLDSPHRNAPIGLDFPGDQIAGFALQCLADFLWNCRLTLGGDLGYCGHDKDSLFITSLPYYVAARIASATLVTASLPESTCCTPSTSAAP